MRHQRRQDGHRLLGDPAGADGASFGEVLQHAVRDGTHASTSDRLHFVSSQPPAPDRTPRVEVHKESVEVLLACGVVCRDLRRVR